MTLTSSRQAAPYGGAILPLPELLGRRHEWTDFAKLPFIPDDFMVGALVLRGAWRRWGRRAAVPSTGPKMLPPPSHVNGRNPSRGPADGPSRTSRRSRNSWPVSPSMRSTR
jgi:hypothetical protein